VRWSFSWPFREKPLAAPPVPGPSGPADDGAAADADARPADRQRIAGAWRELPPLEPTVDPAPLTAATGPFASRLAGGHRPEPILRPLGHDRSADGPGGLVGGLITPTATGASATVDAPDASAPPAERTLRRAGRHRAAASVPGGAGDAGETDDHPSRAAAATAAMPSGDAVPRELASVPHAARESRRLLTAVQPETLASALAAGPAAEHPQATAARPAAPVAASQPSPRQGAPAIDHGLADGEPPMPLPRAGVVGRSIATGMPARRVGLGSPIEGPVPAARRPFDRPLPAGTQAMPAERPVAAQAAPVRGGAELPLAALGSQGSRSAPLEVSRAAADPASPEATPTEPGGRSAGPLRAEDLPRAMATMTADPGTSGVTPSPDSVLSVRAPAGRPAPATPPVSPPNRPSSAASPVRAVPTGSRAAQPAAPASTAAPSSPVPTGPRASVQRLAAPEPAPGRHAAAGPLVAHATRPIGRRLGASAGLDGADAAARGVAGGLAGSDVHHGRAVPALPSWPAARAPESAAPVHSATTVQRAAPRDVPALPQAARASGGPATGATAQRAVQVDEIDAGEVATTPPGNRGPGSEGAAAGSAGASALLSASEADLDLLARRMYGRLRDRLARELLLDRERAGALADR
jgi:hypothetical protein